MGSITVITPPAISANLYWRTRVIKNVAMTYVSADAKAFKLEMARRLVDAGCTKPYPGRVAVTLKMYPHRPLDWEKRVKKLGECWDDSVRSIDLDNSIKVILDAMKGIAFIDDVWVRSIQATRMEPDEHGARVVVTITPIPTAIVQTALFSEKA